MNKVKVIDAPCGVGKTTWAIQEMNDHDEREYIYCTPFLDEISRIRNAVVNGASPRLKTTKPLK